MLTNSRDEQSSPHFSSFRRTGAPEDAQAVPLDASLAERLFDRLDQMEHAIGQIAEALTSSPAELHSTGQNRTLERRLHHLTQLLEARGEAPDQPAPAGQDASRMESLLSAQLQASKALAEQLSRHLDHPASGSDALAEATTRLEHLLARLDRSDWPPAERQLDPTPDLAQFSGLLETALEQQASQSTVIEAALADLSRDIAGLQTPRAAPDTSAQKAASAQRLALMARMDEIASVVEALDARLPDQPASEPRGNVGRDLSLISTTLTSLSARHDRQSTAIKSTLATIGARQKDHSAAFDNLAERFEPVHEAVKGLRTGFDAVEGAITSDGATTRSELTGIGDGQTALKSQLEDVDCRLRLLQGDVSALPFDPAKDILSELATLQVTLDQRATASDTGLSLLADRLDSLSTARAAEETAAQEALSDVAIQLDQCLDLLRAQQNAQVAAAGITVHLRQVAQAMERFEQFQARTAQTLDTELRGLSETLADFSVDTAGRLQPEIRAQTAKIIAGVAAAITPMSAQIATIGDTLGKATEGGRTFEQQVGGQLTAAAKHLKQLLKNSETQGTELASVAEDLATYLPALGQAMPRLMAELTALSAPPPSGQEASPPPKTQAALPGPDDPGPRRKVA